METAPTEVIFVAQADPECGFRARALGYSIFTQGETMDELREMVRDAVACYWDQGDKPRIIHLHLTHDEVIAA